MGMMALHGAHHFPRAGAVSNPDSCMQTGAAPSEAAAAAAAAAPFVKSLLGRDDPTIWHQAVAALPPLNGSPPEGEPDLDLCETLRQQVCAKRRWAVLVPLDLPFLPQTNARGRFECPGLGIAYLAAESVAIIPVFFSLSRPCPFGDPVRKETLRRPDPQGDLKKDPVPVSTNEPNVACRESAQQIKAS